jgi:hypothetical protein
MAAIWRWYKKRVQLDKAPRAKLSPGSELRGTVRYLASSKATLNLITLSTTIARSVQILDISTHGVGLMGTKPVDLGTFFVLDLKSTDGHTRLKGKVVRQTQQSKGQWALGCVFLTPLTRDQLEALL